MAAIVRLLDLNPRWVGSGGPNIIGADGQTVPERRGVGLSFLCPCATCLPKRVRGAVDDDFDWGPRHVVLFENPIDGGPGISPKGPQWKRVGETFATLSLTPSILSRKDYGGCGWHGFIGSNGAKPGEVITV